MLFQHFKRELGKADVIVGLMLVLAGSAASALAIDFDSVSRIFPLTLAGLLTVTGIGVTASAMRNTPVADDVDHSLGRVLLAALIVVIWATLLLGGAGFVLPTFFMQAALLFLSGVRRPVYTLGIATLVAALAYLFFIELLDIPLPPSRLLGVLQGG